MHLAGPAPATRMALHIQEVERLGHNCIGCEHLLLAIVLPALALGG